MTLWMLEQSTTTTTNKKRQQQLGDRDETITAKLNQALDAPQEARAKKGKGKDRGKKGGGKDKVKKKGDRKRRRGSEKQMQVLELRRRGTHVC